MLMPIRFTPHSAFLPVAVVLDVLDLTVQRFFHRRIEFQALIKIGLRFGVSLLGQSHDSATGVSFGGLRIEFDLPNTVRRAMARANSPDHRAANLKMSKPSILTGLPISSVGLNTHCRAAANAGSRKRSGPSIASASITFPSSEIRTRILTRPKTLAAFASGGYAG